MVVLRTRDARVLVFAVTVTILLAPLAIEPAPPILVLMFQEVAALLAGFVLWIAIRALRARLSPSPLGGAAEAGFIALAFALGLLFTGTGRGPSGPPALAASLGIGLAGLDLLVFGRDPLRVGAGSILFLLGSSIAAAWVAGRLVDGASIGLALALLGTAVATAWITINAATAQGDVPVAARPREASSE